MRKLQVEPAEGLSVSQAEERLKIYGPNEVPEKRENPWILLARKFWGLTAWMLEAVILLSFILHKYLDMIIVAALPLFNGLLGFWQEQKAARAVEALKEKLQVNARVLREGKWSLLPARALVPGDVVRLRAGDFVPADMKLIFWRAGGGPVGHDRGIPSGEKGQIRPHLF